jgi:predicted permease
MDAGAVRALPLAARIGDWSIQIEGRTEAPGEDFDGDWQIVTPGYLQAMRIPLREGRFFESSDRIDGHQVVVVNEAMANHYWPEGALGRRLRIGNDQSPWLEIVGIVGNVRHNGITAAINPKWYRPHEQFPASVGFAPTSMTLVVRTAGNPLSLIEPVRAQARALDPNVPVAAIQTLDDVLSASVAQPRFTMTLLVVFGAIALLLAAVGVYAVMSHSISERTLELGLRRALGATGNSVVGMVMRQGMTVAVVGLVAGVAGALWLTTFMGSLLYEIGQRDAITFVGVPLLLFLVALAASSLPARRAATIEPIRALRNQ